MPSAVSKPDGSFIVVWQASADGTINGNEVEGRLFEADGTPSTPAFQVNTTADMFQGEPSVDVFADGSFVVVWTGIVFGQAADILGQRFDADGARVGTEFAVNAYTTLAQAQPQVRTTTSGFVATWEALDIDDSGVAIVARRFDAGGNGLGSDFVVNTYTTNDQENPDLDTAPDGAFVIVWTSAEQDGQDSGIFAQRYDASGTPADTEFQVATSTVFDQHYPSVHYDDNGITVFWTDEPMQPSQQDPIETTGRCYDSAGTALGPEFAVSQAFDCFGCATSVARGGTGDFVVVWNGPQDTGFGSASRALRLAAPSGGICGDPVTPGSDLTTRVITASDALSVVQAAVGATQCLACVCDVDDSGGITATDALLVLQAAVGQTVTLTCPVC